MKLFLIARFLAISSVIFVPDVEARITKKKRHGIRGRQLKTINNLFSLATTMTNNAKKISKPAPEKPVKSTHKKAPEEPVKSTKKKSPEKPVKSTKKNRQQLKRKKTAPKPAPQALTCSVPGGYMDPMSKKCVMVCDVNTQTVHLFGVLHNCDETSLSFTSK